MIVIAWENKIIKTLRISSRAYDDDDDDERVARGYPRITSIPLACPSTLSNADLRL